MELKEYKCLVVDDHLLSRQVVISTLKQQEITAIDSATDGIDALEKIRAAAAAGAAYNVVFLDWSMPKMSGYDVLMQVRQEKQNADTAIILVSAESEDINVVKALEAGATAYITKPFKPEILVKKLGDIANRKKMRDAS
jgi:CheY-like chemotaxis protein